MFDVPVVEDNVLGLRRMGLQFCFTLEAGNFTGLGSGNQAIVLAIIDIMKGLDGDKNRGTWARPRKSQK